MDALAHVLEALMFAVGEPLTKKQVQQTLQKSDMEVEAALSQLAQKYAPPSGIMLNRFEDSFQFSSAKEYREEIELFLNPVQKKSFSQASLEVLSIIAYRQPVTRTEIEEIRGVKCDYSVAGLLQKGLIEVVGKKDTIGRPLLFGTTPLFLRHFGLNELSGLPSLEELNLAADSLDIEV